MAFIKVLMPFGCRMRSMEKRTVIKIAIITFLRSRKIIILKFIATSKKKKTNSFLKKWKQFKLRPILMMLCRIKNRNNQANKFRTIEKKIQKSKKYKFNIINNHYILSNLNNFNLPNLWVIMNLLCNLRILLLWKNMSNKYTTKKPKVNNWIKYRSKINWKRKQTVFLLKKLHKTKKITIIRLFKVH